MVAAAAKKGRKLKKLRNVPLKNAKRENRWVKLQA